MTKLLQENEDLKEKSEEIREKNYLTEEERKKRGRDADPGREPDQAE